MHRFVVERSFPQGLSIPASAEGRRACASVVAVNGRHDVTWVHSYVSADRKKTFCIYDGPAPEAIQAVAERNGLPVDRITPVRVLNPHFYLP